MSRKRNRGGRGGGRPAVHLGNVATDSQEDVRRIRVGEVIDLGDLTGDTRQRVSASFTYFEGTRIRVNPDLSELDVIDLLEQADQVDVNSPKAMTMVKDYVRAHIHADDFEEFWRLARKHGQSPSQLMEACWRLLDGISGNPTGGRSGSSPGQPETKTSSPSTSSAQVTDLAEHRTKREAYVRQIAALEARRGEDGKPVPVNAAIALQIINHAKTQGIDLEGELRSASATG